jgi:hypothetical protein
MSPLMRPCQEPFFGLPLLISGRNPHHPQRPYVTGTPSAHAVLGSRRNVDLAGEPYYSSSMSSKMLRPFSAGGASLVLASGLRSWESSSSRVLSGS